LEINDAISRGKEAGWFAVQSGQARLSVEKNIPKYPTVTFPVPAGTWFQVPLPNICSLCDDKICVAAYILLLIYKHVQHTGNRF
jgi:hypothetical protein